MLVITLFTKVSSDDIPDGRHVLLLFRSLVHSRDRMVKAQSLHSALGVVLQFHGEPHRQRLRHARRLWVDVLRF
jgi:hypothetical protein